MTVADTWTAITDHLHEMETLEGINGLLGWDQQTMMPPKASGTRGAQMALLARLLHERATDERVGPWLTALAPSPDPVHRATVRNVRRQWERATRVDAALVSRIAEAQAEGFQAWLEAKRASDFTRFAPALQKLLDLTRERVNRIDPKRHPYDVLLDEYDPGTTVADLTTMFSRLRDGLGELIRPIAALPPVAPLDREFAVEAQRALHREVLVAMGYDFDAGRLDDAEHPFTCPTGGDDIRITTHLYANDLLSGLGGSIHEGGHALYEQGLPAALRGTGNAFAASYGLHESQSRFWENFVARSLPFCRWLEGRIRGRFGTGPDAQQLYRASNRVHPGLIRVKADEVTYNLHIIVRFEIELALFEGTLAVADLPSAWNERYRTYLGITPTNDADGVLQDVHWSGGAFGYFPSYTLGNLYAASLGATLTTELPGVWANVEAGDFKPILAWLREKVHGRAHLLEAPDIVRAAVGERDAVEDLLSHLWRRHGALYGLQRNGRAPGASHTPPSTRP